MSWTMNVPAPSESVFEAPPEGSHRAILVAIVDLGTQENNFGDKAGEVHQVYLVWELADCPISGQNRNHTIGKLYTLSLHEKANLRQTIETWRGKKFSPSEAFDLEKLLGQVCALTVMHKELGEGKTVGEVKGVAPLMKGVPKPSQTYKPFMWKMGQGEPPMEAWLPYVYGKTVADKIKASREMSGSKAPNGQAPPQTQQPSGTAPAPDEIGF